MKCYNHQETEAVGVCMKCGKAICAKCIGSNTPKIICTDCSDVSGILTKIENAIQVLGFLPFPTKSSDFIVAYVLHHSVTPFVFLVPSSFSITANQLPTIIGKARMWCKDSLGARWITKECGLNLIVLHEGEVSEGSIQGLVDKTGTHSAILQSITAIDVKEMWICQSKTWVVMGKVGKALKRLSAIFLDKDMFSSTSKDEKIYQRAQPADAARISGVKEGSIAGAMFWMFLISLLLFWLPVIGPLIAGIVGGKKAGGIGSALIAVFLPGVIFGILLFALASSFSGFPLIGAIAGAGGFGLSLVHIGPLFIGAVIGGILA